MSEFLVCLMFMLFDCHYVQRTEGVASFVAIKFHNFIGNIAFGDFGYIMNITKYFYRLPVD